MSLHYSTVAEKGQAARGWPTQSRAAGRHKAARPADAATRPADAAHYLQIERNVAMRCALIRIYLFVLVPLSRSSPWPWCVMMVDDGMLAYP